MKIYRYIMCAVILLGCASCSVTRDRAYTPTTSQLNIQMDDLEYLGETEICVSYRTYLGIFRAIDTINGDRYDGKERQYTALDGGKSANLKLKYNLDRAAHKVTEEYPQATYYMIVNQCAEKTRLFLGSETTAKATVRAYRLK